MIVTFIREGLRAVVAERNVRVPLVVGQSYELLEEGEPRNGVRPLMLLQDDEHLRATVPVGSYEVTQPPRRATRRRS